MEPITVIDPNGYTPPYPPDATPLPVNATFCTSNAWPDPALEQLLIDADANHIQLPLDGGLPPGRPVKPLMNK